MTVPGPIVAPHLIFDGDCAFCTSTATWLERRLAGGRGPAVVVVPWQFTDLAALGTTAERARHEVLFVDERGAVSGGAQALARWLIHRGGPYRVVGRLLTVPPVRQVAAIAYRIVAANRSRLPGGTPACALPRPATPP